MIPTPELGHIPREVYEPAEDTFLLLDALENDAPRLANARLCLEIGSGSGCVSAFAAQVIGSACYFLCTDINSIACNCTTKTGIQNNVSLEVVNTDFASSLLPRLRNAVDVLLFNPPYVPTEDNEAILAQTERGIQGSWAGGKDGMRITNQFLPLVHELLSPSGQFYLVTVKENNVPNIQKRMLEDYGLSGSIVLSRQGGRESLAIVRFHR